MQMRIVGTQETIQTNVIASYVLTKTSAADMKVKKMENDLINRSELLKTLRSYPQTDDLRTTELFDFFEALINNAPTVEPEVYMTAKDYNLYLEGYKQGRKDFARQGECRTCIHRDPEDKKCDCGGLERVGCSFPVSDDYFCKFYEKGGAEE